ncbi:Hsp70 family protein [Dactylosporangium sp. NBC_01737]|uniref:Hsp70 family protein n=1 Tax=Dactylosporangium sp. NBC_01737 TaxID=2975959 RepID=UPI002E0E50A3|nr:Hsp70 family protein [Dactylosporangium sp. NBC_01737]
MPTPGIRLGVDFGTSNTVAVVRWPDGRSRALLFDGSPLLPSAVYAEPGGTVIVGRDAVHSARLEPARFEPNPKRRIDDGTVLLGDREIPVNDLVATVLRRVRDEWTRTVGDVASEVTVTFPASWGATRRLAIADAAAAAGLGRVRLVPEPVAAAAYFTQVLGKDVPVGSVVVVHDFGAGTFDASVVARTQGGFEVLAVDGRDDIGGIDLDNAIVAHIGAICEPQAPQEWQRLMSPQTIEDRRARRLLFDDARVAKERLSRQPASDLTVPLLNIDVHLTRDELERLAQPLLEQTVRVTQGVMRWAQLSEGSIAGVFLVGGSSRMPLVGTLLHRALGTAPVVIEQPELVVAEGSMLTGSTEIPVTAEPAPGPATGVIPRVPGFDWRPQSPTSGAPQPGAGQFGAAAGAGQFGAAAGAGQFGAPGGSPAGSAGQFGAAQPGGGQPGAGQFGAAQPGGGQAGAGQFGVGPAGGGQPGQGQSGAAQPGAQPGAGQPGGGQSGADAPLWPEAGTFATESAASAAPMSGVPMSAPPVSSPPGGGYSTYPASAPPGNYAGSQATSPHGGYGVPTSGQPVNYGPQVSVPPANYNQPASAPPANYNQPMSGPPASYNQPASAPPANYNQPMSGPPASYNQPMSGPPAGSNQPMSGPPASSPPVSAPPNRAAGQIFVSGGRVPVSPGPQTEPATRYDEYGSPVRQGGGQQRPAYQQQRPSPVHPAQRGDERRADGGTRRRGPFARAMLTLLVLVLLIATPVVAGYVSFYFTAGHWPPPADTLFDPDGR